MKKILIILLLAGFASSTALAQSTSDVYMPQVVENDDFYSKFSKMPVISKLQRLAIDANQLATIKQEGTGNDASLTQKGVNNIGAIFIDGNNNTTSMNQDGNGLLSVLNIRGDRNNMNVDQVGDYLQNYVQVTGTGIEMDIKQNANGINLKQYGGQGAVPLQITHESGRVPIIINNN